MDSTIGRLATLFKALGDETRLRILGLLLTGEVCVCHLHESLGITQTKASRHLAYLRRSGLVTTRRKGLWIYYRLADDDDSVVQTLRQAVAHALGHVPAVHRDARQLQKKTGCCLPEPAGPPVLSCCEPAARPAASHPAGTAEPGAAR